MQIKDYASKCRKSQRGRAQHNVHQLQNDSDTEDEILTGEENTAIMKSKIFALMTLAGKSVRFQIDTGATCKLISKADLPTNATINASTNVLVLYNKSTTTSLGSTELYICLTNAKNGANYKINFVVVNANVTPVIGSISAQQIDLLKIQHHNLLKVNIETPLTKTSMLVSYKDVFTGDDKINGKLHLEVDESVKPVILPPRRVPVALKQALKDELMKLEEKGTIKEVNIPTDWVSSMVIVKKKSGKIRLCIDPKPLNKALK